MNMPAAMGRREQNDRRMIREQHAPGRRVFGRSLPQPLREPARILSPDRLQLIIFMHV